MTGGAGFLMACLRLLPVRPSLALEAAGLWLTGRRVRARNRLSAGARQSPNAYRRWIATVERVEQAQCLAAVPPAPAAGVPRFSLLLHNRGEAVARTVASLEALAWPDWELVVVGHPGAAPLMPGRIPHMVLAPASARNEATALAAGIAAASGEWIVPLADGMLLPPTALARYAEALAAAPATTVLYGDHDEIDAAGRRSRPWWKPRWNSELFLAQDHVSPACAIAAPVARAALPLADSLHSAGTFALLLRATSSPGAVVTHVPHIQAHLRQGMAANRPARMAALARHLADRPGVALREGPGDTVAVEWPMPAPAPLVSVIVPSRDNAGLLRACVHGVLARTRYRPLEVLIVDNGSTDAATLAFLGRVARNPRVRVLRHAAPFNFAELNNLAVREARGEYLCLLNDDTEVTDPGWLGELVRQAARPEVGAVGAKLLYPDGSIQHAGVTLGIAGTAGHAHRFQRPGDPGYFHRADVAHCVSAVTAACLVVSRAKYVAVGGMDEVAFPVAFNDVDLCLKLEQAGWHNLYQPAAVLVHHESKSRRRTADPARAAAFRLERTALEERWRVAERIDPLHHPRLDRNSERYLLRIED